MAKSRETDRVDDVFGTFINNLFEIRDHTLPNPGYKSLYEKKGHSLVIRRAIVTGW